MRPAIERWNQIGDGIELRKVLLESTIVHHDMTDPKDEGTP